MSKKMGRGSEPSEEELEFLFSLFVKGEQDTVIHEEYEDKAEFPPRNARWIGKKRRYFYAAKKVLADKLKDVPSAIDPEPHKRHVTDLLKLAELWTGNMNFQTLSEILFLERKIPVKVIRVGEAIYEGAELRDGSAIKTALFPNKDSGEKERKFGYLLEHLESARLLKPGEHAEWQKREQLFVKSLHDFYEDLHREAHEKLKESLSPLYEAELSDNSSAELDYIKENWAAFVKTLKGLGQMGNLAAFLKECVPLDLEENRLVIGFRYAFHKDKVESPNTRPMIKKALNQFFPNVHTVRTVLMPRHPKFVKVDELVNRLLDNEFWFFIYDELFFQQPHVSQPTDLAKAIKWQEIQEKLKPAPNNIDIANLGLKSLWELYNILISKHLNSERVKEIIVFNEQYQEFLTNLRTNLELFIDRHELPGTCKACAATTEASSLK